MAQMPLKARQGYFELEMRWGRMIFIDLIHRFYDGVADLLAFFGGQGRQQAVRFGRPGADPDRKVIGPPIVKEPLAGDFHQEILAGDDAEEAADALKGQRVQKREALDDRSHARAHLTMPRASS
jgi:hypothetical protein